MRKSYRVKREKDFNANFKSGMNCANRKICDLPFATRAAPISVSAYLLVKKLGNAVTRNRIKRLIRHVLMKHQDHLVADEFCCDCSKRVLKSWILTKLEKNLVHVLKLAQVYRQER